MVARVVWDHQVGGSSPSTRTIKRRKTAFSAVFLRLKYEFQISPDHISRVVNCSKNCAQCVVSRQCGHWLFRSNTIPDGEITKNERVFSLFAHFMSEFQRSQHIFRLSRGYVMSRQGLFHCLCDAISELLSAAKTPAVGGKSGRKHF